MRRIIPSTTCILVWTTLPRILPVFSFVQIASYPKPPLAFDPGLHTATKLSSACSRCLWRLQSVSTKQETWCTSSAAKQVPNNKQKLSQQRKQEIFRLLGSEPPLHREKSSSVRRNKNREISPDQVLASPISLEPLTIYSSGPSFAGGGVKVVLKTTNEDAADEECYSGRTDAFYNLLSATNEESKASQEAPKDPNNKQMPLTKLTKDTLSLLTPPHLLAALVSTGILPQDKNDKKSYLPMRDLFTSPSVSIIYENVIRQVFARGGFPDLDAEFDMIQSYFQPSSRSECHEKTVVVDMSCATGFMTRKLANSGRYDRVIGCDYSEAMLLQARRRLAQEQQQEQILSHTSNKSSKKRTQLDWVQCDVAHLPMQSNSITALHAGAAMHCWPDIHQSLSEIHRVLQPKGRFLATTFLAHFFSSLGVGRLGRRTVDETLHQGVFQLFESLEEVRELAVEAGFEREKVEVELLGSSCVVVRCEK